MCAQFKHLRYFLIFVESLPSMDQVTVNVAGFASRVHSFDILVESCMHGVAKNKKEEEKKKKGRKKEKEKYKYHRIDIFNRLFSQRKTSKGLNFICTF